jgi:hypothetical protein
MRSQFWFCFVLQVKPYIREKEPPSLLRGQVKFGLNGIEGGLVLGSEINYDTSGNGCELEDSYHLTGRR